MHPNDLEIAVSRNEIRRLLLVHDQRQLRKTANSQKRERINNLQSKILLPREKQSDLRTQRIHCQNCQKFYSATNHPSLARGNSSRVEGSCDVKALKRRLIASSPVKSLENFELMKLLFSRYQSVVLLDLSEVSQYVVLLSV